MADPDPMTCDPGSRVYDPDPGTVIPDPIYLVTTLIKPFPISDPSGQRPKGAKHHIVWGCRYLCNLYKVVPRGFDGDIFKRCLKYRTFSHDVMAAILVMKHWPCWCTKIILWQFNSFLM